MGRNLTKILGGFAAPKVVSDILDNQDPIEAGKIAGIYIRKLVTNQIGDRPYRSFLPKLVGWFDACYEAFKKSL